MVVLESGVVEGRGGVNGGVGGEMDEVVEVDGGVVEGDGFA